MDVLKPGKSDQSAPLIGMIAVVAAAMGLYFLAKPLEIFRPSQEEKPQPPLERRLPARLWQDPIELARKSVLDAKSGTPLGQVDKIAVAGDGETRVLAVTVYGGYEQLDHETRLRSRYAVDLALEDAGYVIDDDDNGFLRFFEWPTGGRAEEGNATSTVPPEQRLNKVLPFEQWNRTGERRWGEPEHVLVLWVDDTLLGEEPAKSLRTIVEGAGISGSRAAELQLIGPSSSTILAAMIRESRHERSAGNEQFWPKYIHSPWATADEVFLFEGPTEDFTWPFPIDRTIATDLESCCKLIEELSKRGIHLGEKGAIAVLAEWDTVYGRAWPLTFAGALRTLDPVSRRCRENATFTRDFRSSVRRLQRDGETDQRPVSVIYLRGLDGLGPVLPGETKDKASGEKPSVADLERPDGTSQLDYARRLADRLNESQTRNLRAVGVLGSDIYDKLLLLQALREKLPDVLFFTTDLDAGYVHPSQTEWARNLIVASSFGLYEDAGASTSPPYRDTYGVAIHRAVSHAVTSQERKAPPKPMVFEIGRTAAHLLPIETAGDGVKGIGSGSLWWVPVLLLAGVLLTMHWGRTGLLTWMVLIAATIAILAGWHLAGNEEPFLWLEGISVWPTETIRLVATVAAVLLLLEIDRSMRQKFAKLDAFVGRSEAAASPQPTPDTLSWRWDWLSAWRKLLIENPKPEGNGWIDVGSIWSQYQKCDEAKFRWWRAGMLAGVLMAAIARIMYVTQPLRPCRGSFSCGVDLMLAVLSMGALILLTCYVADATATCNRFILCLASVRARWQGGAGDWGAPRNDFPGAWHDVEIVARLTQVVGHMVLYPFFVLLLLFFARSQVFDRWTWIAPLMIMFLLPLGLALVSAILLRQSAEKLRKKSYGEVRRLWSEAVGSGDKDQAERSDTAMKSIEAESRGAFSPFTQNPVLAAILLPLSGAGTGLALEKVLTKL